MHAHTRRKLLTKESDRNLCDRECVRGIASEGRIGRCVRGETLIRHIEVGNGERSRVRRICGTGMDHHRDLHPVEDACVDHVDLAATALLGGSANDLHGGVEVIGDARERDTGADAARCDDVVAARVPEPLERIVFSDERNPT